MNTVQLECFMEVCTCLNFSRAAENLRMTQPAVSHQINSLEAELGTKLFNRTSKSVELTRDGIRFMGPASDALKILRNAKARISEKKRFRSAAARRYLPGYSDVRRFAARAPAHCRGTAFVQAGCEDCAVHADKCACRK